MPREPVINRLFVGRLRVSPFSKAGFSGRDFRTANSLAFQYCPLKTSQFVGMGQFVAFDSNVAIAAKGDAVGGLKSEFGVVLDWHHVMRVNVPRVAAADALLTETAEHGVTPALVLRSLTKAHKKSLQNR